MPAMPLLRVRQAETRVLHAYAFLRYVIVLINVILNHPTRINCASLIPVSYTHLDVYKRQENSFTREGGEEGDVFQKLHLLP